MKNIILLLEDNMNMNEHIKKLLKEQPELSDYRIESVHRIDLARDFFDEHKYEICCIITDLNMNDEWLDVDWITETNGGIFSGWVWLRHCVYNRDPESKDSDDYAGMPDMPTIICSGYTNLFEEELKKNCKLSELRKSNIRLVPKGAGEGMGFSKLFAELKEILDI